MQNNEIYENDLNSSSEAASSMAASSSSSSMAASSSDIPCIDIESTLENARAVAFNNPESERPPMGENVALIDLFAIIRRDNSFDDVLITSLLEHGIKDIYVSANSAISARTINDVNSLIEYVEERGIIFRGFITTYDLLWRKDRDTLRQLFNEFGQLANNVSAQSISEAFNRPEFIEFTRDMDGIPGEGFNYFSNPENDPLTNDKIMLKKMPFIFDCYREDRSYSNFNPDELCHMQKMYYEMLIRNLPDNINVFHIGCRESTIEAVQDTYDRILPSHRLLAISHFEHRPNNRNDNLARRAYSFFLRLTENNIPEEYYEREFSKFKMMITCEKFFNHLNAEYDPAEVGLEQDSLGPR